MLTEETDEKEGSENKSAVLLDAIKEEEEESLMKQRTLVEETPVVKPLKKEPSKKKVKKIK